MSVHNHSVHVAEQDYRKQLRKDLRFGALAGLLAGAAIMILFFGYDVLWFRPLATPDILTGALLGGGDLDAGTLTKLRSTRIAIFSILHLVAFVFLGILFARFFRFTQLRKTLLSGGLFGLIVCTAVFSASMQLTGTQMSAEPGWPAILAGNFGAGIVMVIFLRRAQGVSPSG
jgi:hypothetical protein